jgi:hypothetical protein
MSDVERGEPVEAGRLAGHATVGARLALLSDVRLAEAVAGATPRGQGFGGRLAVLDVEGVTVFVKRVPLTDLELRPENLRSTANLFGLPVSYHYGLGSAGFGAWRELAAHLVTTGWVLGGACAGFPLLYHWRVLPDDPPDDVAGEIGGVDAAVARWDGSAAVRDRLTAVARSSASLVLFMEYVPHTLADWLADHRADASPWPWVLDEVARVTTFTSGRGLVHFDAHCGNLLTDGRRIYVADFGLTLSRDFELSPREAEFLTEHLTYDHCYALSNLLHRHLVVDGVDGPAERGRFLRAWLVSRQPERVPARIAELLDRHARPAVVVDDFHRQLLATGMRAPYPAELRRAAPA